MSVLLTVALAAVLLVAARRVLRLARVVGERVRSGRPVTALAVVARRDLAPAESGAGRGPGRPELLP